ncbi:lytic murein transglycosylase [Breoghania sp. L-A4]|nr:lytic murein transglycosylase [Breoghania sp. L-A4]AXS42686.1 lytic murein transglycosylase [Breoghania sp. L-A4]
MKPHATPARAPAPHPPAGLRAAVLLLALAFCFAAQPASAAPSKATVEAQFRSWLARDLWPRAKARGVSRATFDTAFSGVALDWKLPDLRAPGAPGQAPRTQQQAEFRSPQRYFSEANLNTLVAHGRTQLAKWRDTLAAIEQRYGVSSRIVVAIWGRETGFGAARLPHNAIRVLATQAFMGRRKQVFEEEVLAALEILEQDHFPGDALKSSWAGALGHPQFLPSKFLKFAVDFDGDGKRDIWNSVPDSLASIANYLKAHGWQTGRDWGFEARIPEKISCTLEGPERGWPISDWVGAGAARISGRPFPAHELASHGHLLMPAGRLGPAFVATPNFYVLKTYNESDAYALFIGHLADRFGGNKPFVADWSVTGGFSRRDVQQMQQRLERAGYDVGGADGLIGFKTRTAIGLWQEKAGLPATCFPDKALIGAIR